jgi:hypothetical protein
VYKQVSDGEILGKSFFRQPDCKLNPAKEFQSSPPRRAGAAETRSTSLSLADPNNFQTEKRRGVSLLAIACYKRNSHTSGSLKRVNEAT